VKFGSLFSGIGGFDLGFERAGMSAAWQCEIDKQAQVVLRNHFGVEVFNDVRTIGKDTGTVDLICGGFPCQDVSVAGKRAGLAGERSGLWFEFARIIDELEPGWVVIENVPGLLSSNGGKDFAVIVQWLAKRGYGVAWRVLDAQYFGVPQRRRRVFVVASLGSGRAAEVLFEREGVPGDTPPSREAGEVVASTLRSGAGAPKHDADFRGRLVSFGLNSRNNRYDAESQTLVAFQQNSRDEVRYIGGDGQIVGALAAEAGMKQQNYIAFSSKDIGRDAGELPLTLRSMNHDKSHANGGGQVAIASLAGVRRLTPTECERLQGFPDGWTAGQADTARYRQLGNAVAVPVAEWIGKRIMEQS
jgi:DNA (cytosine-5)-methyltransferase 1